MLKYFIEAGGKEDFMTEKRRIEIIYFFHSLFIYRIVAMNQNRKSEMTLTLIHVSKFYMLKTSDTIVCETSNGNLMYDENFIMKPEIFISLLLFPIYQHVSGFFLYKVLK